MSAKKKPTIVCDRCGKEWLAKRTKIEIADWNGMQLQYFLCPKCKKLYRIGLRDGKWYELLEDFKKAEKRLDAAKVGRITDERTINGMVGACEAKKLRLQQYDGVLQSKYQGTFTRDKDGTINYLP